MNARSALVDCANDADDLICGNIQLRIGRERLYVRFDITEDSIKLQFEGPWTGFVSLVLVKIEYARYVQGRAGVREIGKELYRWQSSDPGERHPGKVEADMSDTLREILDEMKGGQAFFFSVLTTRPSPGPEGWSLLPAVEQSFQKVRLRVHVSADLGSFCAGLGRYDMLCPVGIEARCACHCRKTKRKLVYGEETCAACDNEVDNANNRLPDYHCHLLTGGAMASLRGGDDDEPDFDVHLSSEGGKLKVKLAGRATAPEKLRYLSIVLLSTEGARVGSRPAPVKIHNVELFRIPNGPPAAPPGVALPPGVIALLDDTKLIGSVVSRFLVTTLLPGEQLPAQRL